MKTMFEVTVERTKDGEVLISQPGNDEGDSKIIIHPDQVDLLCAWMHDARDGVNGFEQEKP